MMKLAERHVDPKGVVSHLYLGDNGERTHRRYRSVDVEASAPNVYEELKGTEWVKVGEDTPKGKKSEAS